MHMIDDKIVPDGAFITIKGIYASVDDGLTPIIKCKGKIGEYSGDYEDEIMEYIRGVAGVDFFYVNTRRRTFWEDILTKELLRLGRVGGELMAEGYYPLKVLKKLR